MTIDPRNDDDVRDLLHDLAATATPFGPAIVQAIHRKATRHERFRNGVALTMATLVLLAGGTVALDNGLLWSTAPPAGARHLMDWPAHGTGSYVLSRHLDEADDATMPTLTKDIATIWDRQSKSSGHNRVRVLYSDEVAGAGGQIIVVAQGLSPQGQARLAVFTGYLPGFLPPGVQGTYFRLTSDVTMPLVAPRAVLIALNGLARPPAADGSSRHPDQSAVIVLTSPSAAPSNVRIDLPPAKPEMLALNPTSGYAVAALGAQPLPLDRAEAVFSLVEPGESIGHPFHVIGPETSATTQTGWPSATILMAGD